MPASVLGRFIAVSENLKALSETSVRAKRSRLHSPTREKMQQA
jgi:hypothetical protein